MVLLPLPLPVEPLLPLPVPLEPLLPLPLGLVPGVVPGWVRLVFEPLLLGSVGCVPVPLVVEPFGRVSLAPSVVVPERGVAGLVLSTWFLVVVAGLLPFFTELSFLVVCADAVLMAKAQNAVVAKIANFFIIIDFPLSDTMPIPKEKYFKKKKKTGSYLRQLRETIHNTDGHTFGSLHLLRGSFIIQESAVHG